MCNYTTDNRILILKVCDNKWNSKIHSLLLPLLNLHHDPNHFIFIPITFIGKILLTLQILRIFIIYLSHLHVSHSIGCPILRFPTFNTFLKHVSNFQFSILWNHNPYVKKPLNLLCPFSQVHKLRFPKWLPKM